MKAAGDFHLHTKLCGHASGEMEEYVVRALELGLPAMGFSEHFPVDMPQPDKVCMEPREVELYVEEARRLRAAYRSDIAVLIGFEVDFFEEGERRIERDCLDRWKPDYVTGSIHVIGDWPFDHPKYIGGYADWKISDLYREYYRRLESLVDSGLFDVVGHMDLVKKFGYRPEEDVSDAAEAVLDRVSDRGMLIEANTAGFDKPVGEMYPSGAILSAARRKNVRITMGSDSHAPSEVGRHFAKGLRLLAEAGFSEVVRPSRISV